MNGDLQQLLSRDGRRYTGLWRMAERRLMMAIQKPSSLNHMEGAQLMILALYVSAVSGDCTWKPIGRELA